MEGDFLGKFLENPKTVSQISKIMRTIHDNQNSGNSGRNIKWNRNFQEGSFEVSVRRRSTILNYILGFGV